MLLNSKIIWKLISKFNIQFLNYLLSRPTVFTRINEVVTLGNFVNNGVLYCQNDYNNHILYLSFRQETKWLNKETFAFFHKTVMSWEMVVTMEVLGGLDAHMDAPRN